MSKQSKRESRPLFAANFQKQATQEQAKHVSGPGLAIPESWQSPKQKAIDESRIRSLAAGLLIQKHPNGQGVMVAIEYYANSRPSLEISTDQDGNSIFSVEPSKITREQAIAEISALAVAESGIHTVTELPRELAIAEASPVAA